MTEAAEQGARGASPLVSVIVPVRNRRELLRRTLDALERQTFTDYEVIVVDDGSTDGSFEEAADDADHGRPVRVIPNASSGAVGARLSGVEAARGSVLAFTDSDCVPDAGWLAAGVAAVQSGADVVQGLTRPTRPPRPLERTVWSLKDDGLYATCNVFYRRGAYDDAGGFDPAADGLGFRPGSRLRGLGFGEDTLLGWRVRRAGRAVFIPEAVVEHHVFPVDATESLRRAWTFGAFPALLRQVPEVRLLLADEMRRGRQTRAALYLAAASTVAGRWGRRAGVAVLAGWAGSRYRLLRTTEPSPRRAVCLLPLDLAVEVVSTAAWVSGSVRARVSSLYDA